MLLFSVHPEPEGRKVDKMLTLKKVKEMVKAPAHTKRVPSPKVLLEEGRIFLRKEFEHGSHLTLYHNGYVWFSAGKRNTVFHIHDCRGDYAYGASKGKGEVIKEEYFENCEWHIRALFEGEQRVEESQLKCEGVGQTKVSVSYHAVAEDWGEMADSEMRAFLQGPKPELLHHQKFFENGTAERAKESGTEQNYNMIDGCVNNVPKKPRRIGDRWSVLDRLHIKQAERRQKDNTPQQEQERSRKS